MSFFKWLFTSSIHPAPVETPKGDKIKALRERIEEHRRLVDESLAVAERKFIAENPDRYKLVIRTDSDRYDSKEISASASHHKRRNNTPYCGRDEESRLTEELSYGPYSYVMPTLRTAKENAELLAQGIIQLNSHYRHEETNTFIPAREIKSVVVEKINLEQK